MQNANLRYRIWTRRTDSVEEPTKYSYETKSDADEFVKGFGMGSASGVLGVAYFVVDTQAEPPAPRHWLKNPYVIAIIVLVIVLALLGIVAMYHMPDLRAQYLQYQTVPVVVSAWMNGGAR